MRTADVQALVVNQHVRRRRRAVAAVVICVVTLTMVTGWVVERSRSAAYVAPPDKVPAQGTLARAGIVLGSGPVTVDIYYDYLCPSCRRAEPQLAAGLDSLLAMGRVTVVYHAMGHLDAYSEPAGYSSRAAAAAGCAADQGRFREYSTALFERQPAEGGPGLSDDDLIALGTAAGIASASFAQCVHGHGYAAWATFVTETAYARDITATPTVLVGGELIDIGPAGLAQRVATSVERTAPRSVPRTI